MGICNCFWPDESQGKDLREETAEPGNVKKPEDLHSPRRNTASARPGTSPQSLPHNGMLC